MKSMPSAAALAAIAAALAAPAHAATETIPTRDFFRHAEFQDVELSPDGQFLAVTTPRGRSVKAATVDLKTMKVIGGMNVRDYEIVYDLTWIGDRRFVFQLGRKVGSLDQPVGLGQLYAADANGKRIRLVYPDRSSKLTSSHRTPRGVSVVSPLLDEPESVMIRVAGTYPDILRVHTIRETLERVFLNPLRGGYPLVRRDGTVIGVIGQAEDSHEQVVLLGDGSGEWTELSRYKLADGSQQPVAVTDSTIYLLSDVEQPTKALVAIDRKTGERRTLVSDPQFDVEFVTTSTDGDVLYAASRADYPKIWPVNDEHEEARLIAGLLKTFPDSAVRISGLTPDRRHALVSVFSDRDPGRFFRYDIADGKLRYLLERRRWIDPERMAARSPIQYKARDGLTIHGYLTLPPEREAKALPLVVIPHGGPHGVRDDWSFDPEAQFLAHHGYAVLQVNFRGSGGYGREFLRAGFRRWGKEMIDDVTDGVRELVKAGIADRDRICIYGASYGGYSAMISVAREPDLYRCGIGYVGVYDLTLMYERGDIRERPEGVDYLERVIGRDEADLRAQSPITHADKIRAALFLVHGGEDRRVPIAHYKRFTARLEELGKPYESLVKPKEAHGFYDEDNREELYERLLAFLDRHIGGQRKTAR